MLIGIQNFLSAREVDELFNNQFDSSQFPDNGVSYFTLTDPFGAPGRQRKYYSSSNLEQLDTRLKQLIHTHTGKHVRSDRGYGPRVLTYNPGMGLCWHSDQVIEHRIATAILYLNDSEEYKGGQLEFENHGTPRTDKGDLVLYSTDLTHRVTDVTEGVRQSFVLFYYTE